jgi:hypothetical protein
MVGNSDFFLLGKQLGGSIHRLTEHLFGQSYLEAKSSTGDSGDLIIVAPDGGQDSARSVSGAWNM